jgi:catechol-2,3-dioxygenase
MAPARVCDDRRLVAGSTNKELAMKARRISAVVCSGDLEQSETFYEQVVGLTLSAETIPNHLLFECGDGTTLLVYGRPTPNKKF